MALFRPLDSKGKFGFFTTPNYPDYEGGTPDDIGRLPTMDNPFDLYQSRSFGLGGVTGTTFGRALASRFTNTNVSLLKSMSNLTGLRIRAFRENDYQSAPKLSPLFRAKNLFAVRDKYFSAGRTDVDVYNYKRFYQSFYNVGIDPELIAYGEQGHTLDQNMLSESVWGTGFGNIAGWAIPNNTFGFSSSEVNKPELAGRYIQHTGKVFHISLVTSEFSYTPYLWDILPESYHNYYSHVMMLNLTTNLYVTDELGPPYGRDDSRSAVSADTVPFGVVLCRRASGGGLYIRVLAPDYPEFEEAVGEVFVGYAINHTPPGLIPPEAGAPEDRPWGFEDIPLADYSGGFPDGSPFWNPLWRKRPGYVLEVFLNEDRTQFTFKFNGEQFVKPVPIPAGLTAHITNREPAMVPTVFALQNYRSTYDKTGITLGAGGIVYRHRLEEFHNPISFLTYGWDEGVDTRFPDFLGPAGAKGLPFYMNRPDGLVSAPMWANLGSGWDKGVNRSALWQRNNPR